MSNKKFHGKVLRQPSGKAGEYSYFVADAHFGCSNGCGYCYLKRGCLGRIFTETPHLKAGIENDYHAIKILKKEIVSCGVSELQKHGLFLNSESDPFLEETALFTCMAIGLCLNYEIPIKLLTKRADWVGDFLDFAITQKEKERDESILKRNLAFGFTLTGNDEMEPFASPNAERIEAMKRLHDKGYKTWASIEPIIDFESSTRMIREAMPYCDHFKVGLMRGYTYDRQELALFVLQCTSWQPALQIYLKDGLLKQAGIDRDSVVTNMVGRDYNIFTGE